VALSLLNAKLPGGGFLIPTPETLIPSKDIALSKSFTLHWPSEKSDLRVRAEFYNALNHPQFADPDTSFTSATFGIISGTVVNPRVGQLALKFEF